MRVGLFWDASEGQCRPLESAYHRGAAKPSATPHAACPILRPAAFSRTSWCASRRFLLISRSSCYTHTLAFAPARCPFVLVAPRFTVPHCHVLIVAR